MKRVIETASDTDSIIDVSDEYEMLMSDPVQRKIFANIYILEPDALESYIRGVLDLADISHISLPGVERLDVAVAIHGAEAVMDAFHSMFGKQQRGK